eukprot:5863591-Pyramimonas_sp.AAC.1
MTSHDVYSGFYEELCAAIGGPSSKVQRTESMCDRTRFKFEALNCRGIRCDAEVERGGEAGDIRTAAWSATFSKEANAS